MSFFFNGIPAATSSVSIDGGVNFTQQALSFVANSTASGGTIALGTVPAGKQWKIYGLVLNDSAANGTVESSIQINGVKALCGRMNTTATTVSSQSISVIFPPGLYILANAGEVINLVTAASKNAAGAVYYVEEAV